MVGEKFDNTHERILEAAKAHFLKYGFEKTSLRDMCKDAGVTTGCFYRHFLSKEHIFESLVQPFVDGYSARYNARESAFIEKVKPNCDIRKETLDFIQNLCEAFILNLEKYRDFFILAVKKSKGTKYENFKENLINNEDAHVKRTLSYLIQFGFKPKDVTDKEIHMINTAFYNGVLKVLDDDFYDKDYANYLRRIFEFFTVGWLDIFDC